MALDVSMALTTLATMKSELGITDSASDTYLERQINVVSQKIANYCNRNFKTQTYTLEKYEGNDELNFNLNNYPVTSVSYLKIDDTEIDIDDVTVDEDAGILYYESVFNSNGYVSGISSHRDLRTKNISVTYIAGYVLPDQATRNLPYDLEDICIEEIKYKYGNKNNKGKKISSWSLDKASKNFVDEAKIFDNTSGFLFESVAILDSVYKRYLI